jgi:hypothetical protein
MFVRLILSSVLVCSLVMLEVAAAGAASKGQLKGRTAQGYAIKVAMRGESSFDLLRFKADLKCRDGSTLQLIESGFLPTRIRDNGSFRDAQFGRTDSVYFKGRAQGTDSIRGRVRLTDELGKKKIPCKSRWIGFRVR